jgi:RNA polymerase primary sigma factor
VTKIKDWSIAIKDLSIFDAMINPVENKNNILLIENLYKEEEKKINEINIDDEIVQKVIKLYFGLNGHHTMTLEEIGEKFNLTRERVRQIKEKAIRRLRHVSKSKALKGYLG